MPFSSEPRSGESPAGPVRRPGMWQWLCHALVEKLEGMQEVYPGLCGFMNWAPVGTYSELVRTELSPKPGDCVLDFGCGRGAFTELFDARGYLGIDLSRALVSYARRSHPSYAYAVMDGASLGLSDVRFDAVLILGVLHHMEDKHVLAALHEVHQVLKPGGLLLIVEPIPVVSRWNVISRILKGLDLGDFIRQEEAWHRLVSSVFSPKKYNQRCIGFNDLVTITCIR